MSDLFPNVNTLNAIEMMEFSLTAWKTLEQETKRWYCHCIQDDNFCVVQIWEVNCSALITRI